MPLQERESPFPRVRAARAQLYRELVPGTDPRRGHGVGTFGPTSCRDVVHTCKEPGRHTAWGWRGMPRHQIGDLRMKLINERLPGMWLR
jgi:hypothetical protein